MSKNQTIASPGAPGIRGDVSFIRATPGPTVPSLPPSNQSAEKYTSHHTGQIPPSASRLSQDIPIQPHLFHQHHLHQRQPHHQQPHLQQYLPEHMESQQYALKQPHGAGGASGDSVGRVSSHTGVEGWSDREEALATELEEAK
ncbi:unnamed protein product, partial [Lymnaea stagnalis]